MGWCSATPIFDSVASVVIDNESIPIEERIRVLAELYKALADEDWDCQGDSEYYEHPIFAAIEELVESK